MYTAIEKERLSENLFTLVQRVWKIQVGDEAMAGDAGGKLKKIKIIDSFFNFYLSFFVYPLSTKLRKV